jgi:serine/threonine-protein kinase
MPPEASGRDFLVPEEAAHAVSTTVSEKGEASMKNPQQKQKKGLGSVGKKLTTCAVGAALSCTTPGPPGPLARSEPPPEECPAAALQAMADLGIDIGEKEDGVFREVKPLGFLFVREGWATIEVLSGLGRAGRFNAKGRLFFGEGRVYGRFTQAQELKGTRTWPVCLELLDSDSDPGMPMESGSTADTARIQNTLYMRAVERFP